MKKVFSVLFVFLLMVSLMACSSGNNAGGGGSDNSGDIGSAGEASSAGDKKTITLWTFADTHKQYYEEMKKKFEADHPNITIKIELLEYTALYDKYTVISQSGGKDAPDLIDVEQGAFPRYINGEVPFEPLNPLLERDGLTNAIPKGRMDLYTVDQQIYGLEIAACVNALYYRKDLFDQAGIDVASLKTWDEFNAAAKGLTGKNKYIFSGTEKQQGLFEQLLRQEGGDAVTADGKLGIHTPEGAAVLQRISDWKEQGIMSKTSPEGPQFWEAFTNGEFIAAFGADWWAGMLVQNAPDLSGKWAAVPMPLGGPNSVPTTVTGGTGIMISKFSKNKQEAWDFMKYTHLIKENIVRSFQIINLFPALTSAAQAEELHQETAMTKYFGGQDLATLYADLGAKAPSQNQSWWRALISKAWDKYEPDYNRGKMTPEEFLSKVEQETQSLIKAEEARK